MTPTHTDTHTKKNKMQETHTHTEIEVFRSFTEFKIPYIKMYLNDLKYYQLKKYLSRSIKSTSIIMQNDLFQCNFIIDYITVFY